MGARSGPPSSYGGSDGVGAALAALAPLLFVFMPRPPLPGSQFLVYPAIGGVLATFLAFYIRRSRGLPLEVVALLLMLLLYSSSVAISLLLNAPELRMSAPAEIFRPALLGIFLTYGYFVAVTSGSEGVHRGLLWAAYAILLGQLVIAATQIAGIPAFDLLYDSAKSRPFGRLLRATGSVANPNIFGWIVGQAAVIVSLLGRGSFRFFALGVATLLIVASGSRTLLLLFPFMLMAAHVLREPTNLKTYLRYSALGGLLFVGFLVVIFRLGGVFPYLAELQAVFSTGTLTSIHSMAARLSMWEARFAAFQEGGMLAWLVGIGSRDSNAVVDNDFLYVFFRYGSLGLFFHMSLIASALYVFVRARDHVVAIIGLQYVLFGLVYGLVAESLASWHIPLLLFTTLGMAAGLHMHRSGPNRASEPLGPRTPMVPTWPK